jgi:peptide/nickel transport system substrate-binding protein/oligopeptide transport system substrate-binding protein
MAGAAGTLAAVSGLTGCMKKDDAAASDDPASTLAYFITNPPCIDPYNDQDVAGNMVARQLFDPLLTYDFETGELTPCACESYTASSDGMTFEFKIKQGNTFHNGEVVDAAAFVRGWTRVVSPTTGNSPSVVSYHLSLVKGYDDVLAGRATELAGLSCPDDYTFKVELSEPFMDFPMVCTIMCTAPVPEAALEDFDAFYKAPIGNGAYQMQGQWVDGQYIYLTRYEDYKNGELASIKDLHFVIQKDVETGYREFEAGTIDICDIPTAQVATAIEKYGASEDGYTITPGHQVLNGPQPSVYYLTCNCNDAVMSDVRVRRAVSLAINREALVETLFDGTRVAAGNLVAPDCKGYVEGAWEYCHYDKDAAEAILDEVYPKDGNGRRNLTLTLSYNLDGSHKEVMEAVAADLDAVGITVKSDTKEWAAVLSDYNAGNYQIGRTGWIAEYPAIDNFLYPLCYTGNGDNVAFYSNALVDEALLEARATPDEAGRLALYEDTNVTIGQDCPYIPLMYYRHSKVGSSRIAKAYLSPIEISPAAAWTLTAE